MEIVAALHCFVQVLARTEAEATALTGRECCSTDDVLRYLDSKQPNADDKLVELANIDMTVQKFRCLMVVLSQIHCRRLLNDEVSPLFESSVGLTYSN